MKFSILFIAVSHFFPFALSLNIVFYTYGIAQSHISFFHNSVNVLIERGHNVDVVFAIFNKVIKIPTIPGLRRNMTTTFNDPDYFYARANHIHNAFVKHRRDWVDVPGFDEMGLRLCREGVVHNKKLLEFLKSGNYDIGLTNDYDPCGVVMLHAAGIPAKAAITPTPLFQSHLRNAGLPSPSSIYGTTACAEHDGSIYDKIFHLLRSAYNNFIYFPRLYDEYTKLARSEFGSDFPHVSELEQTFDVVFANSNEIIEQARPISHKIKYIGNIGRKAVKSRHTLMPSSIQSILDRPSRGVVLFSFGTQILAKATPLTIRRNFLEAFRQFSDFEFIWKYETDVDDLDFSQSPNVHRFDWLPQLQLLESQRIKLFICHMGLNSFLETSTAGVPVLSVPLFVDQQHNAQNAVSRKTGLIVDRDKLTVDNLVTALNELLNNSEYEKNAKIVAKMIGEKPETPEQIFIDWLEFAAENPQFHKIINPIGIDLSPFYYYSVDVILILIFFILTLIFLSFKFFKFFLSKIIFSSKNGIAVLCSRWVFD